jgi:hypothetical protein
MSVSLATKGLIGSHGTGGLLTTLPPAVWNYLLTAITTSGSIGKLLKDDIDTTVSSRATQSSITTMQTDVSAIKITSDDTQALVIAQ